VTLRDLRSVTVADVVKAGRMAGTLERSSGGCVFTYLPGYQGPPVAWTLPTGPSPVIASAGAVPPFFAGLLPEGRRLTALRRALKTSADDDFSLLLAIGHDTIGDVQVLPRGATPARNAEFAPADLSEVTFDELYARVLQPDPQDRVGLPGIQAKLSDGMISLPLSWGDRPSILKLEPPEFPGVVDNEAHFLTLAGLAGLRVPDHEIVVDAVGASGLLVARFDRVPGADGGWQPLAQEDGCQALGRYPADKYRVTTEDVLGALAQSCDAPIVAARDLFRSVVFAYLTANGDAHAKNFSIGPDVHGEWRPTPSYDQLTTYPYGDVTNALSVGGRSADIGRRELLSLAGAVALRERAAARVISQVADVVEADLDNLAQLPFDDRRIHKLSKAIRYRLERVRR